MKTKEIRTNITDIRGLLDEILLTTSPPLSHTDGILVCDALEQCKLDMQGTLVLLGR